MVSLITSIYARSLKAKIAALGYDWRVYFHANCKPGEQYRCDVITRDLAMKLIGQGDGGTEFRAVKNAVEDLLNG